jgi:hypothetical protein
MRRSAAALAAAVLGLAHPARAQEAIFGRDTVHGLVEIGWAAADGEKSFVDGGFGKTPFSGSRDGGWRAEAQLSQAVVEWRPRFSFALGAVVSGQWQANVTPRFDLDEAYLQLKAPPTSGGRFSARGGVFYPPVSLEHAGLGWTTTDLLSASALNSWIGEEVKVGGLEASYERRLGEHTLTATAAVFGWNDTSGTLLSFRGWALDGLRTGPRSEVELPPLSPFIASRQADETYPMWEIDRRAGYYGRLEWRPPAPLAFSAFYYDNRGDRTSVRELQWAWETRFANLGLAWDPQEGTHIKAQAMRGETWMGYARPRIWADVRFQAAYLLATRDVGEDAASARLDWFENRTHNAMDDDDETGWAATAGWRHRLGDHADLMTEVQRVQSKRPARVLAGENPRQVQDVVHTALRLHF